MTTTAHWSSRFAFLMAAVGSAVGLGNIWKFPYMAGSMGGSAFVLVYLGCVLMVGVPILIAELMLGRKAQKSPLGTMIELGRQHGGSPAWGLVGAMGVVAALLILSFYSVVAGWALAYVPKLFAGDFAGATAETTGAAFGGHLADPLILTVWHALFMLGTVLIVARGVQAGIEKAVVWLMPMLFLMLLLLVGYAAVEGDFAAGMAYLFAPDFSKISADVVIAAAGQAFFSLSIGLGTMLVYGAYLPRSVSLPSTSVMIGFADTTCALLAGIAIFPIVFANGLNPGEGPGLVFVTLPVAFGNMPGGSVFGGVFFILLFVAAITSSVSLLEPVVNTLQERTGLGRGVLCWTVGGVAFALGMATVFSFNLWADFHPFGGERTVFDWIDYVTSNVMLPLGGVCIAILAGWMMDRSVSAAEFGRGDAVYTVWRFLVRFVAPAMVVAVAYSKIVG
ncbi:MAG TPA: sodium-dependent transporter [Azospirillaceae bacterium]|nr:sodium-dependent transporter [Azospirillaceae bacterium]